MKKIILLFLILFFNHLTFSQCLSGNYTIGGASPSFTSITQAVNTLTVNGVCGPVTFNIRPGTYNERIALPVVAGTSSVNTITFQSETTDSSSTIIQAVGNSTQNYVVKLDGTDYVSIKNLTLKNTDANYMCLVYLINGVVNFNLSNCVIDAPVTSSILPNANRYLINSATPTNVNCIIQNSKISGGQRAIYASSNSSLITDFRILNCIFLNQYEYSISLSGVRAPKIISNKISYNLANTGFKGMYISSSNDVVVIDRNSFDQTLGESISLFFATGNSTNYSSVSNNRINISGGATGTSGIYLQNASYMNVYHNSVVSVNTNTNSSCVALYTMANVNIKNNIFYHKGVGVVYYIYNTLTNAQFDYNDIYYTGSRLAFNISADVPNFGAWKGFGYDSNSLNYLPQFVSASDFHIASDFSQNLPIPFLPSVPIDIEGTLRDNISPYFGAYEFANTLNVTDASINKIELIPYNCVGNNPVNVLLKNLGSASLNSVTINWSVNGAIQTPFNWSGNLNFYDTISATIGNLNFVNLGTYNVKAWTTLPNGTTDAVALNDSASSGTLYTSLNGIYTVGGASPSFTNLTSAVTNLKNRGVCGNVTFNLRNGTYNESLNLPAINGLNGANSLLIQSESGNNTSVQIVSTTTLNTVLFSGASNVTIKNMTIGGSSILANAVVINSGGNNLEINNCIINAQSYYGIQSSLSSGGVNQLRILNNTFSSGYYSVYLTGSTTYKFTNLKVVNNTITSGTNSHITVSNADTLDFNENKAITPNTNGPAISITNSNKINVLKNKVNTKDSPALSVTNTSNALIANNMLMGYGSSASSVLNIYGTNSTHIIHNSINSITTNTNCYTFYYYSNNYTGSGNHVWNNIIQNDGMSIPVYVNNSSYQPRFKNNVYSYSGSRFGNFNGAMVQNLTDWKTTSLTDTNSVMLNPQFVSSTDLHANEILLNNAGVSTIADISDDVDGDIRNVSTPDIGADEFVPLSVDAATNGFNFNSILCAGTNPVQVVLKNNGSTTLNSAKLNCKVNSTTLSVYNWSGSLAPGTQTLVTIGTYSFALGTSYSIKAWSTLPNGISDVFRNNDTTSKVFSNTGMSGIYTIGGTSPDFSTINSAVAALKNGGVCGPVTFNIRNGIYNEQVKIPNIKGVSATNTILFKSQSLDSSLVSIEYAGTSAANYVLTVDSLDYITFYKLGFKTLSTSYSNILSFTNKTTHVQLKNCSFTGQTSNGNLLSMSANCDSSLISNNRFYRGSTSISLAAASNSVMNNYFEDQSQYSIYGNGYNLTYSSNKFYFPTLSGQAIYVYGTSGGKISKNKISYNGNNVSAIGLYNCGSLANPVYVANNFISVNGTGSGIDLSNLQYVNVIHNSINQTGNGSCVSIGTVNNSLCQNNIFYNSTGYCITTNTLNPSFSRNYNCIYSPVNKLISVGATTYSTLAAYTATTSMEANSISNDPLYTTFSDLHITNSAAINGSALYNSNVTDDIDGDIRSNTTPDMGADEFVLLNIGNDVQVLQVYVSNQGCGGAQTLYAKIKNIGVNNLSSVQLSGKVAGTPISQVAWSGNLAQGQIKDSISLGTISSLYGNTTIKIWTFSPNGAADGNLINDTLVYQTPNNALKGVYKIGGASPDFVNLRTAKNALVSYGICGPVVFNIRPGTYQDTLSIPSVVGSSTLNTITFQSENGDSSSVIISDFPATAVLYPHYAIQLRNINNIVFSKLTFQQNVITNGNNASLLYGYYNYGNYSNILIKNCRFIGNSLTSYAVNLASMQSLQNFQFKNNTVLNGAYGINLSNINSNASTLIKDNQFYNQLSTSISYGTVTGTNTIENNTIKNTNSAIGININQTYSITIRGNKVVTYTGVGINVNSGTATIFNNFVLVKNASTVNGLFLNGLSNNSKVSFNTVRVKSTSSVVYAQYTGLNLQNNIFENKGTGQVYNLYSLNTSTITNNRCFTSGTTFGILNSTNYPAFANWKGTTGFDSNSQNSSTYFLNDSSYKISGDYNLNGKAIPIASIADDIEYQPRNASTPDIGAYEFDLQNNDAGITRFINPLDSVLCNGNNSISVVLRNFGALALNSCNINWKLNSVVQPVYSWTGALASGDSTVVTIGSVNIVGGRRNKLSIYTSLPNGSVDLANANDSLSTKSIKTRLSGNYTIGGVLPNYSTLKQAADSLQMYGVCGPVTYSIRDGIYNSKFNLSNVIGTSAVNSVVFQSQSMDSSLVTISDTGQAISLYSVKYFTFRKLRFNQASNYNYPSIAVGGASGNIAVTNCIFSNSYSSSNYVYGSIRLSVQDSANRNFVFKQNNFSTTNIVFDNSSSTLHPRNVVVSDNYFSNGAYVLFNNVDSLVFSRNKFYNSNGNVVINVQNCNRELFVVNNISRNGSISIQNCNGNSFSKQVVNNLLDSANISLSNVPKIDIYHNTISLNSPSVNGYACIAITGDMALQRIRNNILSNVANGVCLKIYDPLFNGSNYPNIFSNNVYNTTIDTLGYSSALGFFTKSNWVNILNQDQNSVFARPAFVSNHDFHITNDHNINDLGAPNSLSLVDLDGVARNVSAPDVGVYEFNSAITTNDAGILNVQTPNGNCDRISNDISVLLKNFGTNALTSANITWSLNNTGTTTYSWTGSLAPGATTLISVGSYTPQNMLSHITAYSSLPNGNTDGYIHNDTLISTLSLPKLNGIYTVGGSSADFSTFADVLNSLQTNGICGPVTFKFNPGGYTSLYSNAFDITNIQGNNSQNTITFESASQNNSNVVFTDLAMTLKYVTGITFRNVTFSKSNIVLGVNSKKITFEGNIFNDYPVYNSGVFSMITSNSY
ncbi:MAG: hypothetical protein HY062_16035, partial [Bacteroidetes bacterium]|nr:hypothetical protein [Bacteroidota bacterium]